MTSEPNSTPGHSGEGHARHPVVRPATAAGSAVLAGQTYYFCSTHCKRRFEADPVRYAVGSAAVAAKQVTPSGGAAYTCPMHPEVRQDHLGACPLCGMGLEAVGGAV